MIKIKTAIYVAFFLGLSLVGHKWLAPIHHYEPTFAFAADLIKGPAPNQGQKKVIFKNLGMV